MFSVAANAQEIAIDKLPNDTVKINRLIEKARKVNAVDPGKAEQILQEIFLLSKTKNYKIGLAAYYALKASNFINQMKLDSGKLLIDKALSYVQEDGSVVAKNQMAGLYNSYGTIYQQKQLYDSAVAMYLKSAKYAEATKNYSRKSFAYGNISILYSFLNDTLKTGRYARMALAEARQTKDTSVILRGTLVLINNFAQYTHYDSIPNYANPALKMAHTSGDIRSKAKLLQALGVCYAQNSKGLQKATAYYLQALNLFAKIKSPYDEAIVLVALGENYLAQKEYVKAVEYLEKAIKLEDELGLLQLKTETLLTLSTAVLESGNSGRAYLLLNQYVVLNDSLSKKTNEEKVQTIETHFQLQKKEDEIALQQANIRQKNTLNYILAGGAAALLIIILLGYRNYRHRQKLQTQRITELETEKQLTATEAVLKGEEQERTRLAKDLHDGLGGMLSGLKHSFGHMQGNLVLTPDNALAFNRGMDMLDSSIKEMRRVAHNMMPEALVKFGLDTALKDFCMDINLSGALKVDYQSLGMEDVSLDDTTAITIFRIVQELLNNTMKHAVATHVIVQLAKTEQTITVTVEDDGKGFNPDLLTETHGIGWANIKNRVDFLKGKIDVKSEPDQGTSVLVQFKV